MTGTDILQQVVAKLGEFKYIYPEFNDLNAVTLGPYQLENQSVYIGQWKNKLRSGKGKQIWKDGSQYEGY